MTIEQLTDHLMQRLREVQERLGADATASPDMPFAEAVDSMGLVEFVGVIAADCAVKPEAIEEAVGRRFSTIADLARALNAARIEPRQQVRQATFAFAQQLQRSPAEQSCWLVEWSVFIPNGRIPTVELDRLLERPPGWLEQHAGIRECWYWQDEDPLERATWIVRSCLETARTRRDSLAALLVTGEAPWRAVGQAASLHAQLGLPPHVPPLEVGGACLGFLHCLWLGQRLARPGMPVLIVAIEAPSSWLSIKPGAEGETAALFGDAIGACLLAADRVPGRTWPLRDLVVGCDGRAGDLVEVDVAESRDVVIRMDGPALALRAVQQLVEIVRQTCDHHGLHPTDLGGVYIHAGNGRMAALVARQLGLSEDRVISTTATSGNLGSVTLLRGVTYRSPAPGPVMLAAVGAGLCWGAALFDALPGG
jgi:3-oxoacyl-[acyl-carrier-protein] synthase III